MSRDINMHIKPPTVASIAEAAGISKTSAVGILNNRGNVRVSEATRKRVLEIADAMGYRRNELASALSRGRTGAIALVVPVYSASDIYAQRGAYLHDLVMEVATALSRSGLTMSLVPATDELLQNPQLLANGFYDGAILASGESKSFDEEFSTISLPLVRIGPGNAPNRVCHDNFLGIDLGFRHLIELGHQVIGYFGSGIPADCNLEREKAFRSLANQTPSVDARVFCSPDEVFQSISGPNPPTGILCFNDNKAIQLLHFCHHQGISVPQDLSIVGFDDGLLAIAAIPALTTIRNRLDLQAAKAVSALLSLLNGHRNETVAPIPVELIVRESTSSRAHSLPSQTSHITPS